MSVETRNSAQFKREEQLKRWEDSDTNKEPSSPKQKTRKIKFSAGCVFLAACAAGDKTEVEKLLEKDADINTANVDGLTALHQVSHNYLRSETVLQIYIVNFVNMATSIIFIYW